MTEHFSKMTDRAFVDACYREVLGREAATSEVELLCERLSGGIPRLEILETFLRSKEHRRILQGSRFAPPGHFYSPIPSAEEIEQHRDFDWNPSQLPGIDLSAGEQLRTLESFKKFYRSIPFPVRGGEPGQRYEYDNPTFSYADAILLHCMIRHREPRRIIEVGAGYSTCAILDTNDQFFGGEIRCTTIEPYPGTLKSLVAPEDRRGLRLLETRLQDLDLGLFQELEAGDILFVDSTHVSKLGSDVNYLIFQVLPSLAAGVAVHFHDFFYPFEYPLAWLEEGRSWNEQYLLRAFLQYNGAFKIKLFSSYLFARHREWFQRHMPDCMKNPGGCIWIEKTA